MIRENYTNTGIAREYKNGNITLKYYKDGIEKSKNDSVLTLANLLNVIDCYFVGEAYCLSNYEVGHIIYNTHSDLVYTFVWSDLEELEKGKTVRLYARKPNEIDREIIENEYN